MAMTIRPARPEDYDEILNVWTEAGLLISPKGRESRAAFEDQLRVYPDLYLVGDIDNRIVGVVFGTHDARKGWINRLAVRPDYRRQGLALQLAVACDAAIRSQGIEIVAVLIDPENIASISLFKKMGYIADVPVVYLRKRSHDDI